jgi:hypothetical protein
MLISADLVPIAPHLITRHICFKIISSLELRHLSSIAEYNIISASLSLKPCNPIQLMQAKREADVVKQPLSSGIA